MTPARLEELIAYWDGSGETPMSHEEAARDTLAALRAYREVVATAALIELPALISELDRDAYSARAERYGSVRIGLANAFGVLAVLRTVHNPLTTAPTEAQEASKAEIDSGGAGKWSQADIDADMFRDSPPGECRRCRPGECFC